MGILRVSGEMIQGAPNATVETGHHPAFERRILQCECESDSNQSAMRFLPSKQVADRFEKMENAKNRILVQISLLEAAVSYHQRYRYCPH